MPRPAPQVEALLAELLTSATSGEGPVVAAAEHAGDGDERWLEPAEAAHVAAAVAGRRSDFAAGRACARAALTRLGVTAGVIAANADRSPRWPAGVTGSISHTQGYAVAAVARASSGLLGVDAERIGRVTPKLYRMVLTEPEMAWLRGRHDEATLATAVFAAKEAFYKAQFQRTSAWVNFTDVAVHPAGDGGLELRRATPLPALDAFTWPLRAQWRLVTGEPAATGVLVAGVAIDRSAVRLGPLDGVEEL